MLWRLWRKLGQVAEEVRRKAEAEAACLEVDLISCWRLGAAKDEVSSLHSQASKDKEVMEKDYHKALQVIFSYDYGCCAFKHNICGDQPKVPNGMPDSSDPLQHEFFVSPRWPLVLMATDDITAEAHLSKVVKET